MCFGVGSAGQLFYTNIAKKTNKSDYKCDITVSISLKFAFNISRRVREITFEPKNAQHRACFDHIIEKAQMNPGSESATHEYRQFRAMPYDYFLIAPDLIRA